MSAASVIRHLDRERFEIQPIAIDKAGRWLPLELKQIDTNAKSLTVPTRASEQALSLKPETGRPFDIIFPVMHGPLCEDGAVQGLMELADVAYVGCGVLASAVGMDKEVAKRLIRDAGLPIVPYVSLKHETWKRTREESARKISTELGFPVFVKPANQGSSVGVHKVKELSALNAALEDAFRYDSKVLVERAVAAREIELAVLENPDAGAPPLVSIAGEIVPHHEFYSYESKYLDENGAALLIPAGITPAQMSEAQRIARVAFEALECEGLARVDLFLDKNTGQLSFNEVNTLPGFTSISMYPKMWEASGIPYADLLSKLVDLGLARHERRKKLVREFHGS